MDNKSPSHVVGIGASAGGLKSIDAFFRQVQAKSGISYVVVQHLSPDFESLMNEIMARFTSLPIHSVVDAMPIEADSIYLIPPRKNMIVSDGRLLLSDQVRTGGVLSLPIDLFFDSLAQDYGKRAIAVVMSGTGSDGSRGIKTVHDEGGLVIVQSPDSAGFDGMPRAAIETKVTDLVLSPSEMPGAIIDHIGGRNHQTHQEIESPITGVDGVFRLLREEFTINFNHYRDTTIGRRLERRIDLTQCATLDEYVELLKQSTEELNNLYSDLLIGTTRFFRDEACWVYLKEQIIPELFRRAQEEDRELRIWTAGCSTGEEAYSIAILCAEYLESVDGPSPPLKIIATDVHQKALDKAVSRWFDKSIEDEVSPERLKKYFRKQGKEYQITHQIRRMVIFAQQDLIVNAPFTNVDLVICRNLLIYLNARAQRKVLSLFHFALRNQAYLFLGSSETLGTMGEDFEIVSAAEKIFRKSRERIMDTPPQPVRSTLLPRTSTLETTKRLRIESIVNSAYEMALEEFVDSGLLVDSDQNILHTFGSAAELLRVSRGQMSTNAKDLLPQELVTVLTAAIHRANRDRTNVRYPYVRVDTGDDAGASSAEHTAPDTQSDENFVRYLQVLVIPLRPKNFNSSNHLVLFQDIDRDELLNRKTVTVGVDADDGSFDSLKSELQYTRENLQAANEELETNNEELQATNEELVAANEEMQSTNEELQASNEELQSTNEELHTVNEELHTVSTEYQLRVQELTEVTNDLENLLENIDTGILFLDRELSVRKFTPVTARAIPVMSRDIGRPLAHIVHNLDLTTAALIDRCHRVMSTKQLVAEQVRTNANNWYLLRILPYMNDEHDVDGCVIALSDITQEKRLQEEQSKYTAKLEASNQNLQDFAYIASHDLKAPVRNTAMLADTIHADFASQLGSEGQELLQRLVGSTHRLQSLIDDLLEFSRVHTRGKVFSAFDCNRAVDEALKRLEVEIAESNAQINRSLLPTLSVDASQITQLFQNLIANAIKFRSDERLPVVDISAEHHGERWEFSISDNGIGIEESSWKNIFVIFHRLHNQEKFEGTGLGLAICKRIVERHSGEIWVESHQGEGSTFKFTLPTRSGAQLSDTPAQAVETVSSELA